MSEYRLKKNTPEREKAIIRFKKLLDEEAKVELRKIIKRRSLDQNGWIHVLFTLYAIEYGHTKDEAKNLLKRECPFMRYSKLIKESGKEVAFLKQTSRLDTKECSEFIEWIYNYAGKEGCYLPTTEEYGLKKEENQRIIRSHKQHL